MNQNGQAQRINRNELMTQARGEAASQATTIEQSRAIAQVQGALVVAQQHPRDTMAAATRMREACENPRLAERAFFSFPRGGQTVSGASIHLATELARCWGNLDYGIAELRRDDARHESEMLAYAWDQEVNLRVTSTFIVPHRRDKKNGSEILTDMRDIYESNANNGARRLRECIFRALPRAYTEEAQELCRLTLEHGGGEPIEARREKLVEAFAALGVSPKRLAKRVGKAVDRFTAYDLGELKIAYRSIRTGEADAGELFPDDSGAEAAAELSKPQQPAQEARPAPAADIRMDEQPGWAEVTKDPADGSLRLGAPQAADDRIPITWPGESKAVYLSPANGAALYKSKAEIKGPKWREECLAANPELARLVEARQP